MQFSSGSRTWSTVTSRPRWVSVLPFFTGVDVGANGGANHVLKVATPASTVYAEPETYVGDSAAVTFADVGGIRLNLDLSSASGVSGLSKAVIRAVVEIDSFATCTNLNARVFDVTGAAAVTGATATQTNPTAATAYDITSADFSANMPTATANILSFQLMATGTTLGPIFCSRADLILYWS